MAKWIYEKRGLKWDSSVFTNVANSNIIDPYIIDPITSIAADITTGTSEIKAGDVGIVTDNNKDAYNAGRSFMSSNVFYFPVTGDKTKNSRPPTQSIRKVNVLTWRIKGDVIGTVVAEEGTYPDDGIGPDGYWYVKVKKAFPELKVNVDGALRTVTSAQVVVDGVLRNVTDIYTVVDGQLKKVK